mgnify:CR=1 FL=1
MTIPEDKRDPGSHPSRVRGLKFRARDHPGAPALVAPFTGAWIEIRRRRRGRTSRPVAPFTGAWIEIPSPYRGMPAAPVAPFTGAWIEIAKGDVTALYRERRTLHGCVD